MNWEAVAVVGSFIGILATFPLVPGLLFGKRLAKHDPSLARHVTLSGFFYIGSEILLLVCGLAILPGLIRGSSIERVVGSGVAVVLYIAAIMIVYAVLGRLLQRRGFRFVRERGASFGADS